MNTEVARLLFRERRCIACAAPFLPPPEEPGRLPGPSSGRFRAVTAALMPPPALIPEDYFCPSCRDALPMPVRGYCPRCGEFAAWPTLPLAPCGACLAKPPPWEACLFYGPFQGLLRQLLLRFKFSGQAVYARALASLLMERLAAEALAFDALVPVPLHYKRLQSRGYNQAQELALAVHFLLRYRRKKGGAPLVDARAEKERGILTGAGDNGHRASSRQPGRHNLAGVEENGRGVLPRLAPQWMTRTVASHPQFGLSREDRVRNTRDIFAVSPEVAGQRILLVDDIYTTGATMTSACTALLRAGAASVSIAVIGRTPRRGRTR